MTASTAEAHGEPGDILETRLVGGDPEGERLEWRLVLQDDGSTAWAPFQVDEEDTVVLEPAWAPLPGSQLVFLQCPVFEALFEGTRGPGKRVLDTEYILTRVGWKQVGDVAMDDMLVAPDGT